MTGIPKALPRNGQQPLPLGINTSINSGSTTPDTNHHTTTQVLDHLDLDGKSNYKAGVYVLGKLIKFGRAGNHLQINRDMH